jgi:hypothetical protein
MKVKRENEYSGQDQIASVARWLDFLRHVTNVSMSELAIKHDMARSNLSTFINSGGRPGSVAPQKAREALFELGVHPNGTLQPKLHRWQVKDAQRAQLLLHLLDINGPTWGMCLRLRLGGGYLIAGFGQYTSVFAELLPKAMDALSRLPLVSPLTMIELDRDGDVLAQSVWMSRDEHEVLRYFDVMRVNARNALDTSALTMTRT